MKGYQISQEEEEEEEEVKKVEGTKAGRGTEELAEKCTCTKRL